MKNLLINLLIHILLKYFLIHNNISEISEIYFDDVGYSISVQRNRGRIQQNIPIFLESDTKDTQNLSKRAIQISQGTVH